MLIRGVRGTQTTFDQSQNMQTPHYQHSITSNDCISSQHSYKVRTQKVKQEPETHVSLDSSTQTATMPSTITRSIYRSKNEQISYRKADEGTQRPRVKIVYPKSRKVTRFTTNEEYYYIPSCLYYLTIQRCFHTKFY